MEEENPWVDPKLFQLNLFETRPVSLNKVFYFVKSIEITFSKTSGLKFLSFSPPLSLSLSLRLSFESQLDKRLRLKPLPPIYSSSLPWTLTLPDIRLDLAALLRSSNSTYQKQIKLSSPMNFPLSPSAAQMDPNQDPEHSLSVASSPSTVSGTLHPYFRLNYLPSIPVFLISLSFPLNINSSSSLIPFHPGPIFI